MLFEVLFVVVGVDGCWGGKKATDTHLFCVVSVGTGSLSSDPIWVFPSFLFMLFSPGNSGCGSDEGFSYLQAPEINSDRFNHKRLT